MFGIDRHLLVLGCGLVAIALLAFGGGLATGTWLTAEPVPGETHSPNDGQGGLSQPTATARAPADGASAPDSVGAPSGGDVVPAGGPPAAVGDAAFQVQVGNFLDQQAAGAIAAHLADRGYRPSVETRTDRTGVVWYAPVVGAYDDRGVATEAAREVARRVGLAAQVAKVDAP
jgi:cell division septation protein DedD